MENTMTLSNTGHGTPLPTGAARHKSVLKLESSGGNHYWLPGLTVRQFSRAGSALLICRGLPVQSLLRETTNWINPGALPTALRIPGDPLFLSQREEPGAKT